jgi:hypothetical protein
MIISFKNISSNIRKIRFSYLLNYLLKKNLFFYQIKVLFTNLKHKSKSIKFINFFIIDNKIRSEIKVMVRRWN